jgi:hypothetical protein
LVASVIFGFATDGKIAMGLLADRVSGRFSRFEMARSRSCGLSLIKPAKAKTRRVANKIFLDLLEPCSPSIRIKPIFAQRGHD